MRACLHCGKPCKRKRHETCSMACRDEVAKVRGRTARAVKPISIGERYGSLVVQSRKESNDKRRLWWRCACDCGQERVAECGALRSGRITGCKRCGPARATNPTWVSKIRAARESRWARMDTSEYLREVPGFPAYYVSSGGVVFSGRTGEIQEVFQRDNRAGYKFVWLFSNGKQRRKYVHALVLEAFVGPRPEGMEGCHFPDPDKSNNHVSNLVWDTHQNNERHYVDPNKTERICLKCGQTKPVGEFYLHRRGSSHRSRCKSCYAIQCAAYYKAKQDRLRVA